MQGPKVIGARPQDMATVWEHVEGWCERSLGRLEFEEVVHDWHEKDCQLWVVLIDEEIRAVFRTAIAPPNLLLTHCSGDNPGLWYEAIDDTVTQFAKHYGCARVICLCRPGWRRMAKSLGWHEEHVEMVKKVA